jgi:Family of unknown function (DUF6220)
MVLSLVIQVVLAGLGLFTYPGFFYWHAQVNGAVVFFLPLLVILVGWLARLPVRLLGLAAAVPALVIVQSLLLVPYHMSAPNVVRVISALHVPNAFFIVWVAIQLVERTRAVDVTA